MVDFDQEQVVFYSNMLLLLLWEEFMHRDGPPMLAMATQVGRFRAAFGASPTVAAKAWILLLRQGNISEHWTRYFLWALLLMNIYGNEKHFALICRADEKTARKWAWFFIFELSQLEIDLVSKKKTNYYK